jgi:fluoroquinolone transport system permease protein
VSAASATGAGGRRSSWRILWNAVLWDLRVQLRYQIVTVAIAVTVVYAVLLKVVPEEWRDDTTVLLVLADPTMIGFLFVGALMLFERGANTLQAVVVSPLSSAQYVWSKAISLTAIAMVCAAVMTAGGHGASFSPGPLLMSVALTSMLFVFIGIAAVARVRTINEYLLIVPLYLVPLYLPLLDFFGVLESHLFLLLPTQASILLLQRALEPRAGWEAIYGLALLAVSVAVAYFWARRSFEAYVRGEGAV